MHKENSISDVIRPMRVDDLAVVLSWRNHPDIRKYMYTSHEITLTEHKEWFSRSINDKSKHLLIFEERNNPTGFIRFDEDGNRYVAEWGFYLAPGSAKGVGRKLGIKALDYAFYNLEFRKVCGKVLQFNKRSVEFHRKLGFSEEGIFRDHYFDGKQFHTVLCFGLLRNDWLTE